MDETFTEEQRLYLQGFIAGSSLRRPLPVIPTFASALAGSSTEPAASGPESIHRAAQDRFLADGKKLTPEEQAKRSAHPLDLWDMVLQHARDGRFPKGTDVFLFKFQGLFYVAPAQDAFMCRLRFAGGIVSSHQFRGVAELAERYAGGYCDVTTRANLQLREIKPHDTVNVLMGLHDLGIINRGAGADNIRNITASPTAGIDPRELIDTRPLAREMHHYILNHREMYGLPRKFNIAFDGGGSVSALEDTNDIGFAAVRVGEGKHDAGGNAISPGVYFRMQLGGITGHLDFARDTGILLKPDDCVPAAAAVIRVFIDHGDRTDRKKARLKYVLDRFGVEKYLEETEKHFGRKFTRLALDDCDARPPVAKHGHIGIHPQSQSDRHYLGVVLPVGRLRCDQLRGLADIADRYGSGALRLTVWQNLLISDIPTRDAPLAKRAIEELGLSISASSARAGLVACTGSAGCKYASADTKRHALQIVDYLDAQIALDGPINIHLTGCHHSCAQHYIGDIGLLATKVTIGDDMVEGYHVFVGGGYGVHQTIARELYRNVTAADAPHVLERMLRGYLSHRLSQAESFRDFVKRYSTAELKDLFETTAIAA